MCGVIGAFWTKQSPRNLQAIKNGINKLSHRGPNDSGHSSHLAGKKGELILGHTRLSIIDLSTNGHQPMITPDGRYSVIFNGEIYNYLELKTELELLGEVFYTDSDTEVLLRCWSRYGSECLPRLRGMFAFVVYDSKEQTLSCVRDSFGIKPFFYCQGDESFSFASEIPALLSCLSITPELDLQQAYDYLVFGRYSDHENTFLEGVKHLLPGHMLTIKLGKATHHLSIKRWWWPSIEERTDLSFEEAAEKFREMFLSNVRLHLRSDVPLGAALSGGLDSSALVCAMRYIDPDIPIHTFSYIARDSAINEERWVDLVNDHVGGIAHKVFVSYEDLSTDLDQLIIAQGEPFGGTSIYAQYRVYKLAKESGITVTLDGQGADELLAGYIGYPHARMRSLWDKKEYVPLIKFLRGWSDWPGRSLKYALFAFGGQFLPFKFQELGLKLLGRNPEPEWLDMEKLRRSGVQTTRLFKKKEPDARKRHLVSALRSAQTGRLSALLSHADRNSMYWSIESRVPFLTNDMAEFLLSLPESYLLSDKGETKHLFRTALRGIVPDKILDRKDKVGFETPEDLWLKTIASQSSKWMDGISKISFLDGEKSKKEVQLVADGKRPFSSQAWRLVNYCRWVHINALVD